MLKKKFSFGLVGIGTMGKNLVLNMSDHGYSVAAIDRDREQVERLRQEAKGRDILATNDIGEFIHSLDQPRSILILVPAGKIVDKVIEEYLPHLTPGDLLIDCGNSHFTDTDIRTSKLALANIHFMGVGISGGSLGARNGPSIMPGGSESIYKRVAPMWEAIAAKVDGESCAMWLGSGSAGHYTKMVHNGIEYGLMQLISEAYHVLKIAGGLSNDDLHSVFSEWNEGKLHSYLLEITAKIFAQPDDLTSERLIDMILDSAHQKGTGSWASADAMNLQIPVMVIDLAVAMRDLSALKSDRLKAEHILSGPGKSFSGDPTALVENAKDALYCSMIIAFAQGMSLLQAASGAYHYGLNLEHIARIWRGGCIIRATILEDIRKAYQKQPQLTNLLLDENISDQLNHSHNALRKIIQVGIEAGIPLPAMMASLSYYDSYRSGWLPANLIQAQRDFFGAHTYER
ncbi:MAG TPA: NADP-dependent phosphogluconate dehydrogenase, partial [Saprospiraceae bacterium]|nr:NADP-dependent phosphogluconate dehydrogenase [Saprospiraceae bacterium]